MYLTPEISWFQLICECPEKILWRWKFGFHTKYVNFGINWSQLLVQHWCSHYFWQKRHHQTENDKKFHYKFSHKFVEGRISLLGKKCEKVMTSIEIFLVSFKLCSVLTFWRAGTFCSTKYFVIWEVCCESQFSHLHWVKSAQPVEILELTLVTEKTQNYHTLRLSLKDQMSLHTSPTKAQYKIGHQGNSAKRIKTKTTGKVSKSIVWKHSSSTYFRFCSNLQFLTHFHKCFEFVQWSAELLFIRASQPHIMVARNKENFTELLFE